MPRKVDVTELVGAAEIAKRLGVSAPQVVYTWRRRHDDFPDPVAELAMGVVWAWADVERWAKATGRDPLRRSEWPSAQVTKQVAEGMSRNTRRKR